MKFVHLDNGIIKSNCRIGNRNRTPEWVLCLPLISSGGGEGQNDPMCLVVKEMLKTCDYIDVQHMH